MIGTALAQYLSHIYIYILTEISVSRSMKLNLNATYLQETKIFKLTILALNSWYMCMYKQKQNQWGCTKSVTIKKRKFQTPENFCNYRKTLRVWFNEFHVQTMKALVRLENSQAENTKLSHLGQRPDNDLDHLYSSFHVSFSTKFQLMDFNSLYKFYRSFPIERIKEQIWSCN